MHRCGDLRFKTQSQDVFLAGSVIYEVLTGHDTPFLPPRASASTGVSRTARGPKTDFLSGFGGGGAAEPITQQARRRAIREAIASGAAAADPAALALLLEAGRPAAKGGSRGAPSRGVDVRLPLRGAPEHG